MPAAPTLSADLQAALDAVRRSRRLITSPGSRRSAQPSPTGCTGRVTSTCSCRFGPCGSSSTEPISSGLKATSRRCSGGASICSSRTPSLTRILSGPSRPSACCSMQRDACVDLHDVLSACKTVTGLVEGKTFDDYAADLLLRSAVERQLGRSVRRSTKHSRRNPARRQRSPRLAKSSISATSPFTPIRRFPRRSCGRSSRVICRFSQQRFGFCWLNSAVTERTADVEASSQVNALPPSSPEPAILKLRRNLCRAEP